MEYITSEGEMSRNQEAGLIGFNFNQYPLSILELKALEETLGKAVAGFQIRSRKMAMHRYYR